MITGLHSAAHWNKINDAAVSALNAILSASENNGGSFTCGEADDIAALFDAFGLEDDKHSFLEQHSDGDEDDEDMHVGYRYRELMSWDDGVDVDSTSVVVFAEHRRARGEGSTYGPYATGYEARRAVTNKFDSGTFDPDGCEVTFKEAKR